MKAKLHKMVSGYILSLNGDIDDPYAIVNKELAEDYEWYKLSLKNCQAIELGYDINTITSEMRAEFISKYGDKSIPLAEGGHLSRVLEYQCGVIDGFKKALEILGDKKFTENNIDEAFDAGYEMLDSPKNYNDVLKEFKESLEPTEWDVEVEMETCSMNPYDLDCSEIVERPKLDTDGCLILKRI